jgi:hypothetical protein
MKGLSKVLQKLVPVAQGYFDAKIEGKIAENKAIAEREKLDREAEQKTRDAWLDVFKAGISAKNPALANAALQKAGMDVTGLGDLTSMMQDAKETKVVGGVTLPWNNSGVTFEKGRPDLEMNNLNNWLSKPQNRTTVINTIKADPQGAGREWANYLNSSHINYTAYVHETRSAREAGPGTKIVKGAIPNFNNVPYFNDLFSVFNQGTDVSSRDIILDSALDRVTEGRGVPQNSIAVAIPDSPNTSTITIKPLKDDAEAELVNTFATQQGYKSGSHMLLDSNFVSSRTMSKNPQTQVESMINASYLAPYRPESLDRTFATPINDVIGMGTVLERVGGENEKNFYIGNVGAQVRAMYPHVEIEKEPDMGLESAQPSGSEFLTSKGHKPSEITSTYSATKDAADLMERLFQYEAELDTTSGIVRSIQSGISGLISEGGTIDQIFGFTEKIEGTESFTTNLKEGISLGEATTADSLRRIALANGYSLEGTLGRVQTLRINLAMKLARAADPSGRLSNQDFDNALKLLGDAGFLGSSKTRQLAGLQETLNVLVKKRADMQPLAELVNKDNIDIQDRKMLIAFTRVQKVRETMKNQRALSARGIVPPLPEIKKEGAPADVDADVLKSPQVVPVPEGFKPTITDTLTVEGQGTKNMVFSAGRPGNPPLGWYVETPDGLIPADANENRLLREQRRKRNQ